MSHPNLKEYHLLTHAQKRVWFTEQIYPGQSIHHIGGSITICGNVRHDLLERAIQALIARHDALRLNFTMVSGEIRQHVTDYELESLEFIDFSTSGDPQARFNEWMKSESQIPFNLEDHVLFRFVRYKLNHDKNGYFVKFHHLIADGWSIQIMADQIRDAYFKFLSELYEPADQTNTSYLDYVRMEQEYLNSARFEKNKHYWSQTFNGMTDDFLMKGSDDLTAKRKSYSLDHQTMIELKNVLREKGCSINTFFVVLLAIYQYKMTGQQDIILGNPVLNRSGKKERSIFGMFTSTMPLRINFAGISTVYDLFEAVEQQLRSGFAHQKYPYNLLLKDLSDGRKPLDGLFQICVNYYNTKLPTNWNGWEVENEEFHSGSQVYALQLVIKDWASDGCIQLDFDYKSSDFSENDIEVMYHRLCYLMRQWLANSEVQLTDLRLLDDEEIKRLVYEMNSTVREYPINVTITELFEAQVERTPDNTAIIFGKVQLTYRQLNENANKLARYLQSQGFSIHDYAVIQAKHSAEVVTAILAVLKLGGVYIPIDPEYPTERVSYILADSQAQYVLTDEPERHRMNVNVIVDITHNSSFVQDGSNIGINVNPKDLVYIIYTSGSTGKPKGVMVEHRGLVNYIWWAGKTYIQDPSDSFALYSSLAFDLTVTSVFTPLIYGNTIIVFRDKGNDNIFHRIADDHRVTIAKLTPSHLALLKDLEHDVLKNSRLRTFIVGGEDLKVLTALDVTNLFSHEVSIYNEYGPTETVVGCMIYRFDPIKDISGSVPIGQPIDNMQIHILDVNLQPLPIGVPGELYIAGDGVARGYMNRSDLTSERFIQNPFIAGMRMYKSGDLARRRNDGLVEYMGRGDYQVKIRGYRIELGEIENQLLLEDGIVEAVVIDRTNEMGYKSLYAYVIGSGVMSTNIEYTIRSKLMKRLPHYMIPTHIMGMERFPLTRNGKVDRDSLPEPRSQSSESLVPLRVNEKESVLIEVIQGIQQARDIGIHSNFYYIGGDSITAIQIASRLKKKGYRIKVKDILEFPVIKEMAATMEEGDETCLVHQGIYEGEIEKAPVMKWLISQQLPELHYYNQSVCLHMTRPILVEDFKKAMGILIRHHDGLRINYDMQRDSLYYNSLHVDAPFEVNQIALSTEEAVSVLEIREYGQKLKSSMNLLEDLMIKVLLFHNETGTGMKVLLTAHHLLIDAVSWRILLEDLNDCLNAVALGDVAILPPKTVSMQEWTVALSEYANEPSARKEAEYWLSIDQMRKPIYENSQLDQNKYAGTASLSVQLSDILNVQALEQANQAYHTNFLDLLLSAIGISVGEWTHDEYMVVELEGHGREEIYSLDISRTIGWFTSIYPVLVSAKSKDIPISSYIKAIKEKIRSIPNKGIGYGALKYNTDLLSWSGSDDLVQTLIRLNYIGNLETGMDFDSFRIILDEDTGPDVSMKNPLSCGMEINVMVINERLMIRATYDSSAFPDNSTGKFISNLEHNLIEIVTHCNQKEDSEYTPSDFDSAELTQDELDGIFH